MDSIILALEDRRSTPVTLRCHGYAGFLSRLRVVAGEPSKVIGGAADPGAALMALAEVADVTTLDTPLTDAHAPVAAVYIPSREARERVGAERDGSWPQSVASRQRKSIRTSRGAIFRFPMEEAKTAEDDGPVEVFITDWSPSPAACAIAVHPAHRLSRGLPPGNAGEFAGRYCRHPLTGDLLPIWVAGWVKPGFGTGAVLVNPAHDKVDLAFGREIGLPIRFALAPEGYDGSPQSWITPPIIKTGVAVRTGVADGQPFVTARIEYLRVLLEHGLAEEYSDFGVEAFPVADFAEEATTEIAWDINRRTVSTDKDAAVALRASASPVLAVVEPEVRSSALAVVAPSTSIESDLLSLRLMLAEPSLQPQAPEAPEVLLVGTVAGQTEGVDEEVLQLGLIVGAAAHESISVKAPQLEVCERFIATHAQLADRSADGQLEVTAEVAKAAAQIKDLLQRKDAKQAFTQLYRLQKKMAGEDAPSGGDLLYYHALAYVLGGVATGHNLEELCTAWQKI